MSFTFFFSSRRRHTRLVSDWSSDVCSSDLPCRRIAQDPPSGPGNRPDSRVRQIGRASCRERVYISVVAVSLKKKKEKLKISEINESIKKTNNIKTEK